MPFIFRGHDVTALLGNPLDAGLYREVNISEPTLIPMLLQRWKTHEKSTPPMHGTAYRSALGAFVGIEEDWGQTFSDKRLSETLFSGATAQNVANIVGQNNSANFMREFEAARDEAFYVFLQAKSVSTLARVSFLSTYYHKDISALFEARRHSAKPLVVSGRVIETARIMLRIIYGNMNHPWRQLYSTRSFSTILLLAEMHGRLITRGGNTGPTGRLAYNQSSVAFTLLTFSYLPAVHWINRNFEFNQNRWYYFWKILGSFLGLNEQLIPDNHAEAEELWRTFFTEGECRGAPVPPSNPLEIQRDRINQALLNGYRVVPEFKLMEWVPSFTIQQLNNTRRWLRYLMSYR